MYVYIDFLIRIVVKPTENIGRFTLERFIFGLLELPAETDVLFICNM